MSVMPKSVLQGVAVVGVLVVLAGCRSTGQACAKPREYTTSNSVPALKVPEGLEAPDTRTALRIPELATPERTRGPDEPCIDEPPPFSTPRATPKVAPAVAPAAKPPAAPTAPVAPADAPPAGPAPAPAPGG